jgi:PST family polysaccharide transporter
MLNQSWTKVLPKVIRTRIEGRKNTQQILINTSWLFLDRIMRMGLGLIVGVWVARYLGPEKFGSLNYALAIVTLISVFNRLGLDNIVIRDLLQNPSEKNEILGTTFILKLASGSLAVLSTIGFILFIHSDITTKWMVFIIALGSLFQAFDVIDFWFQAQVQSKYVVYARNVVFLFTAILKILLIQMSASIISFAYLSSAEFILGGVGLIVVYRMNRQYIQRWEFNIEKAKYFLKSSWLLLLGGVIAMVYTRIDQVMLSQMVGDKSLGIYSSAVKLAEVWYFIPIAITSSVFPSIVEAKKTNALLYDQKIQKLFDIVVLLGYSVAILITFLAPWLINILFGVQFIEASSSLVLLAWAGLFIFLGLVKSSWMLTENLMKHTLFTHLIGAFVNVSLNFYLIPNYGPAGAALASLVSYFAASTFSTALFPETRKLFKMQLNSLCLCWIVNGSLFTKSLP